MSQDENLEKEEITEEAQESARNILKDFTKDMRNTTKKLKKLNKENDVVVEGDVLEGSEEDLRYRKQMEFLEDSQFKIFKSSFRFINTILKKYKIDPISNDEVKDLRGALMGVTKGTNIKAQIESIEQQLTRLTKFTSMLEFGAVIWDICVPRYPQIKEQVAIAQARRAEQQQQ